MKISTKSRYGLRFMIDLAQHWGEGPLPMRAVAQRQGLSKKYLEQIAAPLIAKGLVHVTRGQAGGYELARSPQEITMADVIDATEEGLTIMKCLEDDSFCERFGSCFSAQAWEGLQNAIVEYASSKSLSALIQPE